MHITTRAWFAASLLLLVGAALLHAALLLGLSAVWAALVHLTLFGWISGMIMAVNYHTVPVFSGRDFASYRLIWAQLAAFMAGVALVTSGQLAGIAMLAALGLTLELLAALIFVLNIALLLARGPRRALPPPPPPVPNQQAVDRVATRATSAAGLCLPLALLLLLGVRTQLLSGAWWLAAEHLIGLGWVMLMIVGVATHVLPRFSGHGTRGLRWAQAQLVAHLVALALIVLGLGFGWGRLFAAGGLLMSLAIGLFAWLIWPTVRAVASGPTPIMLIIKEPSK